MKRAVLCLLAACGNGDGAPDAEPPPFMQGEAVMVQITSQGVPVPDVQVMFQNADQSVVSVGVTNAAGLIGADIDDGGFVTVVQPRPAMGRDVVTTFAGVQRDDVLRLDFDDPGPTDTRNVTIKLADDLSAGVVQYKARANCGEVGVLPGMDNTSEFLGCGGPAADFLLSSHDESDQLISSIFRNEADLATAVDFTADPYRAAVTDPVTFMPAMAGAQVGVHRAFATERGIVFETGTGVVSDGATFTATLRMPDFTGVDGPTGLTMITSVSQFVALNSTSVQDWQADPGRSARDYALDLAGSLLPHFQLDPDNPLRPASYDIATRTAHWIEAAGGVEPDLVRTRLSVFRDAVPVGRGWDWRMIARRSGTQLVFPKLPVDLTGFDFTPADNDSVGVSELTTVKLSPWIDQREVRENGFKGFNSFRGGQTGRIVFQDLVLPEPE